MLSVAVLGVGMVFGWLGDGLRLPFFLNIAGLAYTIAWLAFFIRMQWNLPPDWLPQCDKERA
jgi:hypothetical protein